ncbi:MULTISPECIES: SDR family oxidoreductase [unclassified Nocardioides]|uniref:SDR family oxidoreductase n=1 Tax=unclassified Nocardioides TaxID=2615069 RepID=UPI00005704F4|nr:MULTISPECIES: SDR family oxidoreductase [unclassified Nocardioides]ABL81345.1 short-chain dehydrogenase/reductase SDR [Nocardioides sp. JS614]
MNPLFDLTGKTALVTGGGRGIGRMAARGLLQAGATVIIASRKLADCEQTAAELADLGRVVPLAADLSTQEGCRELAAAVAEHTDALHVLVNNAGAVWGAPFAEFPASGWDKVLDLNLKGPFYLTQELIGLLRAAATDGDPARVVNIGSIDGLRVPALPNFSYSAAKAGLHHLTRVLAVELGPDLTVNAIAPGPFASKMMAATLEKEKETFEEVAPMGRIGADDDIAGAIVYLAARASAYVTGVVLPVDGGISVASVI